MMLLRYNLEQMLSIVIENLSDIFDAYFTIKSKLISLKRIFSQQLFYVSKPSLSSHKNGCCFIIFLCKKKKTGKSWTAYGVFQI